MSKPSSLIITPYMSKGGVGKTTTTVHLGFTLASFGKTLIVDADAQGNATDHLLNPLDFVGQNKTFYKYLISASQPSSFMDNIVEARPPDETKNFHGLYLLGNNSTSTDLATYIQNVFPQKPKAFQNLINRAHDAGFRYILIDPPVALNNYTRYILAASSHVLPIIEPESFAFEAALGVLLPELFAIREDFDAKFIYDQFLINKYDKKTATHSFFVGKINEIEGLTVYIINETKSIPFACGLHKLLHEYKPDNVNIAEFQRLACYFSSQISNQ